jgi:hypothetical protein
MVVPARPRLLGGASFASVTIAIVLSITDSSEYALEHFDIEEYLNVLTEMVTDLYGYIIKLIQPQVCAEKTWSMLMCMSVSP